MTTGTQLGFPRLVDAVARATQATGEQLVVQSPVHPPEGITAEFHADLAPDAFDRLMRAARVVVAHAGVGSILDAARLGKPLIILPRRHDLGEHRNDHQIATARHLAGRFAHVRVAWSEDDLPALVAAVPDEADMAGLPAGDLIPWLAATLQSPDFRRRTLLQRLTSRVRRKERPTRPESAAHPTGH